MNPVNQIIFEGQITNEVSLKDGDYGPSVFISVKNVQQWQKKDGTIQESSCSIGVSCNKELANTVAGLFKKGDMVKVVGSLKVSKSQALDSEGKAIFKHSIKAQSVEPLSESQQQRPISPQKQTFGYTSGFKKKF